VTVVACHSETPVGAVQCNADARHGAQKQQSKLLTCVLVSQSKAGAQVKDLMNRLNNAVKQRNAAREEALLASEKLKVRHMLHRHSLRQSDATTSDHLRLKSWITVVTRDQFKKDSTRAM